MTNVPQVTQQCQLIRTMTLTADVRRINHSPGAADATAAETKESSVFKPAPAACGSTKQPYLSILSVVATPNNLKY